MPEPLSLAALLRRGTEERSRRASTVTPGNRPSPQPGNPESSILQQGSSPHARERAVRSAAECSHSSVFTRARALLPLVKREGKKKKKRNLRVRQRSFPWELLLLGAAAGALPRSGQGLAKVPAVGQPWLLRAAAPALAKEPLALPLCDEALPHRWGAQAATQPSPCCGVKRVKK